jgi:hypothetical protein
VRHTFYQERREAQTRDEIATKEVAVEAEPASLVAAPATSELSRSIVVVDALLRF